MMAKLMVEVDLKDLNELEGLIIKWIQLDDRQHQVINEMENIIQKLTPFPKESLEHFDDTLKGTSGGKT